MISFVYTDQIANLNKYDNYDLFHNTVTFATWQRFLKDQEWRCSCEKFVFSGKDCSHIKEAQKTLLINRLPAADSISTANPSA